MAPARKAAFLAIGSELLRSERVDTNSLVAARLLSPCGFVFVEKRVLEDDVDAIAMALRELAGRVELIVVSGGLGPTADDVTREAAARAFGRELQRDDRMLSLLRARYERNGRTMPAIAARMADAVAGAELLVNPQGTAPGQLLVEGACTVVLLPGVPIELEEIVRQHLVPRWPGSAARLVRTLRLGGTYESAVEERVAPLYGRFGRANVTILAGRGLVDLVLAAEGDDAASRLAEMEELFAVAAGADLYGRDDDTLAAVVLELLRRVGWTLATAESCTGGLVAARLTAVPGASDVFLGGVVAYANSVKERLLGVSTELLADHGAVSREVAEALATGARTLGADCGVGITGIAGPSGGTPAKSVGTVHIAVATPGGTRQLERRFPGDRTAVREFAANFALDLTRRALEEA